MTLVREKLKGSHPVRFNLDHAQRAADEWGANCGPGAIAAVLDMTLDEVRPHIQDFERKHYSNPKLVYATLRSLGVKWRHAEAVWPELGLVRVQWEGPWTMPGVPRRARYRHTHWIGARRVGENVWNTEIFDINCICAGGWVPLTEWNEQVVSWLLRVCEPKAFGSWHSTHVLELEERLKGVFAGDQSTTTSEMSHSLNL